jgi:putative PIN family toxin of toxin-antitoxin system
VRVVLDTNVLISGVFFGGAPREVLELWRDGRIQIVLSSEILNEYSRVAARLTEEHKGVDAAPFLRLLAVAGEIVQARASDEQITEDPDDDKFFACALTARVEVIVSGDGHLKRASGWQGIEVFTPAAFVRRMHGGQSK